MTKENEDNTWNEADKMEDGKICFYENGLDYPPTKTYSFRDTHLIYFKEIFNAEGEEPMQTIITISPAIQNYGALMLKRWNEIWVPPSEIMPYQAIENNEPNLLEYHIENLENKIIKEDLIKENQEIYLVIKSKNTKDIIADIDLKNHSIDYEYKGKWMKNNIIKGITLEESLTKVKLKAIKEKKNMGIITLRDYPNQKLEFTLPKVEEDPVKIKIHMVRIYNDGKTILSVINLKIKDKDYYYTSIVREGSGSSPARTGDFIGYLLTWKDKDTSGFEVDSKFNKDRIINMFSKLNVFDTRLPSYYQDGTETSTSHNIMA